MTAGNRGDARLAELQDEVERLRAGAEAWKPMVRGLEAENKRLARTVSEMREALVAFRRAKAFVAGDAYDGIDDRGRELLEIADSLAALAIGASPAEQLPHEKGNEK